MFKPFEDGDASHSIHDLTLENDVDRINIYGNLQITKDKLGLESAKVLQAALNQIVATLSAVENLPEKIELDDANEIENPFL
jgi:hypothetical protein